jgi:hypothetical protein
MKRNSGLSSKAARSSPHVPGLDDPRGFLKYGNHVARFAFSFIALEERHPGFAERPMDDLIVSRKQLLPESAPEPGRMLSFPTASRRIRVWDSMRAWTKCHADHFKAAFGRTGSELSQEAIHFRTTELLVAGQRRSR